MLNLLLTITVWLVATANPAIARDDMSLANASADLALESIHQAELAGADVSGLVQRFNGASDYLQQAERSNYNSCPSFTDCTEKANKIFISIIQDSVSLKEQAQERSDYHRLYSFVFYAPLGAFTASVFGLLSFRAWRAYQERKFLNLEIMAK